VRHRLAVNHRTLISAGIAAAVTVLMLAAAVLASPAEAQTPPGPGSGQGQGMGGHGFQGDLPMRGGWGLLLMDQDMTRDRLMLQLRDQDCEPASLGWLSGGRWSVYVPGAPPWVNQDFPAQLHAGSIFAASCQDRAPAALRLTDSDTGGTFTVAAGSRVRVALTANPTTGFTWTADPAPPATILAQLGDPFFVASSDLVGAGGTLVFDFTAVGPGTTQLQLEYARPFETVAPAQTWSVTITVTQ
jgi:inhibitor of cysteine peptidase